MKYVYVWGNNEMRAQYKGRACRVIQYLAKNSVLLYFGDGNWLISSRLAIRKKT